MRIKIICDSKVLRSVLYSINTFESDLDSDEINNIEITEIEVKEK